MEKTCKLLMTETSVELCQLCREALPSKGIEVVICPRNGHVAYAEIAQQQPDAVLLDIFMPGMDAFSLKRKFSAAYPEAGTMFYATGAFQSDEIEREAMDTDFAFYFLKPFDIETLAERVMQGVHQKGAPAGSYFAHDEDEITDMLRSIGVPAPIKGYRFLRDAILLVVEDPTLINAVTKALYPDVARIHDTTASRVERAIRHAIEVAWNRGDIETLNHYFGATIHSMRGKPTNSEFIAMLAGQIVVKRQSAA